MTRMSVLAVVMAMVAAACAPGTSVTTSAPSGSAPATTTTDASPWSSTAEPCVGPGGSGTCELEAYPDRPYEVFVPSSYNPDVAMPVVVAFHGGGGSSASAATMSCRNKDIDDDGCLHGIGEREGFVTIYPNGTGFFPLKKVRTWNAGGGFDGWNCASGRACENNIDDVAYVDQLLEDVRSWLNVDRTRVYATGLSNGAAFSQRLACERADTFAAVAAVAGSNQFSTGAQCNPERPIAVLQVHGVEDPCWSYETSDMKCIGSGGDKLGALPSVTAWAETLSCSNSATETTLPDTVDDGTSTVQTTWSGCDLDVNVTLLTIIGGGHTWPSGTTGLSQNRVGRTTFDWGSEILWNFLRSYTLDGPQG